MRIFRLQRRQLQMIVLTFMVAIITCGVTTAAPAEQPADAPSVWQAGTFDDRTEPVFLLASLVDAINQQDYWRAWNYWRTTPPGVTNYEEFAAGYADTRSVSAFVQVPAMQSGAAGSVYATLPTLFLVTHTDGRRETFAGCYTLHRSNVPVGNNPLPDPNWSIEQGSMRSSASAAALLNAGAGCDYSPDYNRSLVYDRTDTPVGLLASYVNAVLRREYVRAYNYWSAPQRVGRALIDFAAGYANTSDIDVFVGLDMAYNTVGGLRMDLPVAMRATLYDGTVQYFGGCYHATHNGSAWRFADASVQAAQSFDAAVSVATCE